MAVRDVVLIAVIIFIFGAGFLAVHSILGDVTDKLLLIPSVNESTTATTAMQDSISVSDRMDYVIFALFLGLGLSLVITGYFIAGIPIFMAIYFLVIVISVIISTILSNVWESFSTATHFFASLSSFPFTNHILTNLPIYVAIIGFLGMIVMFAKSYVESI